MNGIKELGFSSLEIMIILCAVFSASLVGWYVWHSTNSSYPITYYNGNHCAGTANTCTMPVDSIDANIKVLGRAPVDQSGYGVRINAQVTKIVSYRRYSQANYPMIKEEQSLTVELMSSALVSSTWPKSCSSSPRGSYCQGGMLNTFELPFSQATIFIQGLQNKVLSTRLSCTSSCDAVITGLAN